MSNDLLLKLTRRMRSATDHRIFHTMILGLVILSPLRIICAEESFTYQAPMAWREHFKFELPVRKDETKGGVLYGGDAYNVSEYCPQDSEYFCVFSAYFAFAVPKHLREDQTEWRVNGYVFRLGGKQKISIMGVEIDDVYCILAPPEASSLGKEVGRPTSFFYSPTVGLIGFDIVRWPGFYWLTGRVGFGAQSDTPATEDGKASAEE